MSIYNPKTLLLLACLVTGMMGFVLLLMGKATTQRIPGIRNWAYGSMLIAVAGVLLTLRDVAPVWLTYTVHNTLVMVAYASFLIGSTKHFGRDLKFIGLGVVFVLAWLAQTYFTHAQDSLRGRYLSLTGFIFAVCFLHAVVLGREILRRRAHRERQSLGVSFTTFWVAFSAVVFGLRWGHAVFWPQDGQGLLDPTPLQALYLGTYTFGLTMVNIGFLLLTSEVIRRNFESMATTDALTGIRSRRVVIDTLDHFFERSRRSEQPFVVMMIDLDHFKAVNDKYGHAVGDEVLRAFCRRVEQVLRRSDVFGRFGGEEFVVLVPDSNDEQAVQLASRLLRAAAASDSQLPVTTVSIGVSEWRPTDESAAKLLERADHALYEAKMAGRNRVIRA